jgi:hypothetical protein
MGTSRTITEKQVAEARASLKNRSEQLVSQGVTKENFPRDTKWRKIDAQIRQISKRIIKIGQVEAINADLKNRQNEAGE